MPVMSNRPGQAERGRVGVGEGGAAVDMAFHPNAAQEPLSCIGSRSTSHDRRAKKRRPRLVGLRECGGFAMCADQRWAVDSVAVAVVAVGTGAVDAAAACCSSPAKDAVAILPGRTSS